jgi:aminoglycoside 6'-N-acetyltransferase
MGYSFRPVDPSDLLMLRGWLRTPEVVRWWGDPVEQAALLEGDLNEPLMVMRIVTFKDRSFAYAQDYDVGSWPQAQFAHLPAGSRAIDAFLGEPDMIGRGHGAAFLRLLARQLICEGAPLVAIDPDMTNQRARRAYRNAGFVDDPSADSQDERVSVMLFRP